MAEATQHTQTETVTQSEVRKRKTNTVQYCLYVESREIIKMNTFQSRNRDIENKLMGIKGGREEWSEL